ncbi:MAG TPA: DUF998 domain-containing protein [Candidatus Lokiarchaeia archaeon]|nr:DUF998 domain-containing protein [Candidatus Lokiarchaeia archaeon]
MREKLHTFFTGRASKRDQLLFFAFTLAVLLTGIIISQAFFPGGYSILNNHISDQGGWANNPQVFWVFDICVVISGILLISSFVWLYRRLLPTMPPVSHLATLGSLAGCVGFICVGLFPQDLGWPHNYAADLAFGGLGLGALLMFFILIRKMWLREPWPNKVGFGVVFGQIIVVGIIALIAQLAHVEWAPFQWSLMISEGVWLFGILLLAKPDEPVL